MVDLAKESSSTIKDIEKTSTPMTGILCDHIFTQLLSMFNRIFHAGVENEPFLSVFFWRSDFQVKTVVREAFRIAGSAQ